MPEVAENLRIEATFHVGLMSLEKKDVETAQSCFKAVLLSSQKRFKPKAQAALMNSLYVSKDYKGVLDVLRRRNYAGKPPTESMKYIIAGRSAFRLKLYREAIRFFANAERQLPQSDKAFEAGYYRLLCFYNIKGSNIPMQVDAFLEVYQKQHPRSLRIHKALLMKAETLFENGKYREAAAAYNQIKASVIGVDTRADLLYKRGWCLSLSGDHNGAVRSYTQFLNQFPQDERAAKALARRAQSYQALEDRVSAIKDFESILKKYPKTKLAALAWQNTARINKEQKNYPEMIRRYQALIKNFPDLKKKTLANAQYWIGYGYFNLQKYPKAIEALEKAVQMDPVSYAYKGGMLILYSASSMKDKPRLQQAVDAIIKIKKGDKVPVPIYRWLAMQCFNEGEMKECDRYLSLGVTPEEPRQTPKSFWRILGKARVETGAYEKALKATKNFLDVAEEPFWKAETLLDRAQAFLGLGKLSSSLKCAKEGLSLHPKGRVNAELRMLLGDIAYQQKRYADAAAYYVVVVQLFVNDKELRPEALYKSYKALAKKGDEKEAQHYLEMLNREFPAYLKKQAARK